MDTGQGGSPNIYHIRIQGCLDPALLAWLGDVHILSQGPSETLLVGRFVDQAALRGVLDQCWNLNLTVLSVTQPEPGQFPAPAEAQEE